MAIAFDTSGTTDVPGSSSNCVVDITTAADDNWVFVCLINSIGGTVSPGNGNWVNASGWTTVTDETYSSGVRSASHVAKRKKVTGDTTFTFTINISSPGTNNVLYATWVSYSGLDATAPVEVAAFREEDTDTASIVTPSGTPTAADRWALGFFFGASNAGGTGSMTFTPDAAMTERKDSNNSPGTGGANVVMEAADTAGAVTQASHSYTAVCSKTLLGSQTQFPGGAWLGFLIPAAGSTDATPTPSAVTAVAAQSAVKLISGAVPFLLVQQQSLVRSYRW